MRFDYEKGLQTLFADNGTVALLQVLIRRYGTMVCLEVSLRRYLTIKMSMVCLEVLF